MIIHFRNLTGEFPRTDKHLLPENAAQSSQNCDFTAGSLRALKQHTSSSQQYAISAKSLFYTNSNAAVLWSSDNVDACNSPVVNDAYGRFYWADGSQFVVTQTAGLPNNATGINADRTPANQKWVGVPAPNDLAVSSGGLIIEGVSEHAKISATGAVVLMMEDADGKRTNYGVSSPPLAQDFSMGMDYDGPDGVTFSFYAQALPSAAEVPVASGAAWTAIGGYTFGVTFGQLYAQGAYYAAKILEADVAEMGAPEIVRVQTGTGNAILLYRESSNGYRWYTNAPSGTAMPT